MKKAAYILKGDFGYAISGAGKFIRQLLAVCLLALGIICAGAGAVGEAADLATEEAAEILVLGHKNPDTDSICSALAFAELQRACGLNATAGRVGKINKETKYALDYFGVEAPQPVTALQAGQQVILVDHNEPAQAAPGLEQARVRAVVDHHRLGGGLQTDAPIFIHFEPLGCTASIVAEMYWQHDIEMSQQTAGLLLSAIISDTMLFRSPTCTAADRATAEKLAEPAGVDLMTYGREMLEAGLDISDMSAADLAANDAKKYTFGAYNVLIAQTSVSDAMTVLTRKAKLIAAMDELRRAEGCDLHLLMLTESFNGNTTLLIAGEPKKLVTAAFGKEVTDNMIELPGVMSRKKQIVPPLTAAAK